MSILSKLLTNFDLFSEKIAIQSKKNTITYRQLGVNAKQIASHLLLNKIEKQCIAIETDDAIAHITAIFGILLSGNSYISVTTENAHYINADFPVPLNYSLLLTTENKKLDKPKNTIYLDEITTDIGFISPIIHENDSFCVFITSGSSGIPKVVVQSHKNMNEDIARQVIENATTSNDKFDFTFSFSFSASLVCIFPPLVSGASVYVHSIKEEGIVNIASHWREQQITFSTMSVSSFLAVCKLNESFLDLINLRFLSLTAEPVTTATISIFNEKFQTKTVLQVAYGTTETRTITKIQMPNNPSITAYSGSMGKAVRNRHVNIIDENGGSLAPYEVGEIIVQSEYIANEYKGNELATIKAFTTHGEMITYKTGDHGYLNNEGELFFAGRKSAEIKLNGAKVDLDLIEQELQKLPQIVRVTVAINDTKGNKKSIVAFIQTTGKTITSNEINASIANKLPQGHYPHYYSILQDFPVTHTGKVDKKKLECLPFVAIVTTDKEAEATNNPTEKIIIAVFNKVLSISNTHRNSSFFNDLGGDSLISMIAVTDLEKQLNLKLPPYCIWAYPTPLLLAEFIGKEEHNVKFRLISANESIPGRHNLYFINTYNGGSEYKFIVNNLSTSYNIIHLLYDSENIKNIDAAHNLITEMAKTISSESCDKRAVLIGFSFHGSIAQQIALICPKITHCVLIDTYNYFEFPSYSEVRPTFTNYKNLIKKAILSRDFEILTDTIKSKLIKRKKTVTTRPPMKPNLVLKFFLSDFYPTAVSLNKATIPNNCLYFLATKSFVFHPSHGYNWKKYVTGKFHIFNIKCNHVSITNEQNSKIISRKILKTIK